MNFTLRFVIFSMSAHTRHRKLKLKEHLLLQVSIFLLVTSWFISRNSSNHLINPNELNIYLFYNPFILFWKTFVESFVLKRTFNVCIYYLIYFSCTKPFSLKPNFLSFVPIRFLDFFLLPKKHFLNESSRMLLLFSPTFTTYFPQIPCGFMSGRRQSESLFPAEGDCTRSMSSPHVKFFAVLFLSDLWPLHFWLLSAERSQRPIRKFKKPQRHRHSFEILSSFS